MLIAILIIVTFMLGMLSGAVVLTIVAFNVGKEKENGDKKERIQTTGSNK